MQAWPVSVFSDWLAEAQVERNLHDAMGVARNVVRDPRLVPGGGAVEMALSRQLAERSSAVQVRPSMTSWRQVDDAAHLPCSLCNHTPQLSSTAHHVADGCASWQDMSTCRHTCVSDFCNWAV